MIRVLVDRTRRASRPTDPRLDTARASLDLTCTPAGPTALVHRAP